MSASFGTVAVGRLNLREALSIAQESNSATAAGRTMKITGQEAVPAYTAVQLAMFQDDIPGLVGSMVPVTFTNKSDRNGYWWVSDAQADLMNWNGELVTCAWTLTLTRAGTDTELDLESRLSGSLARVNSFAATGERIHCPPIGHYAYFAGPVSPSILIRGGSEGSMIVYRGLSTATNPRWGCSVSTYLMGRVRFLDANGLERSGLSFSVRPLYPALTTSTTLATSTTLMTSAGAANMWTLHNTLVQVTPSTSGGVLTISAWTGTAWQAKNWDILLGGVSLGVPDTVTVLRNEPEIVVVRLVKSQNPGRVSIDLTLRRGFRFVEVYVQAEYSTTISIVRPVAESATAGTGYITAASNDGAGNRYVLGSAKSFTADTTNGGISVTSAVALDALVGVAVGGASAAGGDQPADLFSQYVAAASEFIQGVRR